MANISDLVSLNCLVWDTEKPYIDLPRKSANFSLLGFEWNFQMRIYYTDDSYRYKITLHKVTDEEPLETDLAITTFVCGPDKQICLGAVDTGRSANREIWSCSEEIAELTIRSDEYHGRWIVIFCTKAPFTLQHSDSETEHNMEGPDTPLTSIPDSSNLSKSNLSEDKCVQASCLDISPHLESLSDDFCRLMQDETLKDVDLKSGDRNIRAHSSILASRSDVFATMFRNKMAESEAGSVDVVDVDAEVLDLLLKYVYSGKLPELSDDTAPSLYAASDKYSIRTLKSACSDWMMGELSEKNCLRFLVLADTHSDEDFKDRVVNFVSENLEALENQTWGEFRKDHSGLAISVYHRLHGPNMSIEV